MAVSESRKKANQKWDAANMATLACKVKKDHAEQFKVYCAGIGETVNSVLQDYVTDCITGNGGKSPQQPSAPLQGMGAILTPDALKIAQEAAQRAGEDIPAFVSRAVTNQNQRDKMSLLLSGSAGKKDAQS